MDFLLPKNADSTRSWAPCAQACQLAGVDRGGLRRTGRPLSGRAVIDLSEQHPPARHDFVTCLRPPRELLSDGTPTTAEQAESYPGCCKRIRIFSPSFFTTARARSVGALNE